MLFCWLFTPLFLHCVLALVSINELSSWQSGLFGLGTVSPFLSSLASFLPLLVLPVWARLCVLNAEAAAAARVGVACDITASTCGLDRGHFRTPQGTPNPSYLPRSTRIWLNMDHSSGHSWNFHSWKLKVSTWAVYFTTVCLHTKKKTSSIVKY